MKLLFDNNLSVLLPEAVGASFPESDHVALPGLGHRIWQYAKDHTFAILAKDKDSYHLATTKGAPPKVVWLTIGNCTNRQLIQLILSAADPIADFIESDKDVLILP